MMMVMMHDMSMSMARRTKTIYVRV